MSSEHQRIVESLKTLPRDLIAREWLLQIGEGLGCDCDEAYVGAKSSFQ